MACAQLFENPWCNLHVNLREYEISMQARTVAISSSDLKYFVQSYVKLFDVDD
jgi:hypothetical protein